MSALVLILFMVLTFTAAALGAWSSFDGVSSWYPTLVRPSWTPPNWLFGPVWTALYTAMAVAAWLVWRRGGWSEQRLALTLFFVQLTLNAAWSWLFFGLRRPGLAFAEIVVLWLAIAATIYLFQRASMLAAGLLVPYLLWVTFASALNFTLWRLNLG